MNKNFLFFISLSLILFSFDNEVNIIWNKNLHNFGILNKNIEVETEFICYNKSNKKFIIENVKGSCGCVVSNWTKDSINVGDSAIVQIKFNPGNKTGNHLKSATVYSNFGAYDLKIIAEVKKD